MPSKKSSDQASEIQPSGTRITVTLPPSDYSEVRRMAKEKKVSASWIVRDAVEKYIQGAAK
ncbi:MAG: CopG family transcriptional regulator [Chthoniobacterales bacterium]|nr:CopG family transcriptional regulator [Chthoniobacterales bacterium]